jgi:hypothetical protein
MAKWHFRLPDFLPTTSRANGFFNFRRSYFSAVQVYTFTSRELPGSVAGAYKRLLGPGRWPFWCFLGCFVAKLVAVFRSVVIRDPRHTVRLDANSHLVLFPSFSRYITSCLMGDISHMASGGIWKSVLPAGIGYVAGCRCRLVIMLDNAKWVGHSNPQRPSTGSIWWPISHFAFHVQLGEFLSVGQGRWSESGVFSALRDALSRT